MPPPTMELSCPTTNNDNESNPGIFRFASQYSLRNIRFAIFASQYSLRNICFAIFASQYSLRNIHFAIFASQNSLRKIRFAKFASPKFASQNSLRKICFAKFASHVRFAIFASQYSQKCTVYSVIYCTNITVFRS